MPLISSNALLDGFWSLINPRELTVKLNIVHDGKIAPSYEASLGLTGPVFSNATASESLDIKIVEGLELGILKTETRHAITGKFIRLPKCGAAKGVLYRHEKMGQYLLLDPAPFGEANRDHVVFADTHERQQLGLSRNISAKLPAGWLPLPLTQPTTVKCKVRGQWSALSATPGLRATPSNKGVVRPTWEPLLPATRNTPFDMLTCGSYLPLLLCEIPRLDTTSLIRRPGQAYAINLIDQQTALKEFQWLLKPSSKIDILDVWTEYEYTTEAAECKCRAEQPTVQWRLSKKPRGQGVIVHPFEQKEQAVEREMKLKQIPAPVRTTLHCQNDSNVLLVELTLTSLFHHVLDGLKAQTGNLITLRWRIASDDGLSELPRFPGLDIPGYDVEDTHDPDALLTEQEQKFQIFKDGKTLYRRQKWTLEWMLSREERGLWDEWDGREVRLPALDWRIDVEGFRKVKVGGGVLADEVGGGKTITSLALIMVSRQRELEAGIGEAPGEGPLQLRATLILVPKNLIRQWSDEIATFIDSSFKCLIIRDWGDLVCFSIEDFLQADIILAPWQLFAKAEYWETVRKLVLAYNVPQKSGRAFMQWLDEASKDLSQMVTFATDGGKQNHSPDLEARILQYRTSQEAIAAKKYGDMFKAFRASGEPTGDATGIAKEIAGAKDAISDMINDRLHFNHAVEIQDMTEMLDNDYKTLLEQPKKIVPIFHLFKFKRLIVDEFSYLEKQIIPGIIQLTAEHRWMLSGTPTITNFTSLNYIAKLLGTSISPRKDNEIISGFIKASQMIEKDTTSAEEFMSQLEIESPALINSRYKRAELFMQDFMKQNKRLKPKKKLVETIIVSRMQVLETYVYDKAYQMVNVPVQGAAKNGGNKTAQIKRDEPFAKAFAESKSAEIALLTATTLLLARYRSAGAESAPSDLTVLRGLKVEREDDFAAKCSTIVECLSCAFEAGHSKSTGAVAQAKSHLVVFLENILDHSFGDAAASGVLLRLAHHASANQGIPVGENTDQKARQTKLRVSANLLATEVVQIVRELRLLTFVVELGVSLGGSMVCTQCGELTASREGFVLALCGHYACKKCAESGKDDSNQCPKKGCDAPARDACIPASRYLPGFGDEIDPLITTDGAKMASVLAQLHSILEEDKSAYTLVFLQHGAHIEHLKRLLTAAQLAFTDGTKTVARALASAITKFGTSNERILLLAIDSVDAAGWNLQVANHVLFVSPYLTKFAHNYSATMAQAQGRCFRHGQKNDVHVYHFLTEGTMEVEIFMQRQGERSCNAVPGSSVERTNNGESRWILTAGDDGEKVKVALKDMRGPQLSQLLAEEGEDGDGEEDLFED